MYKQLRSYQKKARDAVIAELEMGRQHTLLVLPTGTGKTIVFTPTRFASVTIGNIPLHGLSFPLSDISPMNATSSKFFAAIWSVC